MSVYRQQETTMTDLNVIKRVLEKMPQPKSGIVKGPRQGNFQPVLHPQPVNLIGFAGDKRAEKAQLVIPREQCSSNDVGFYQEKPGAPVGVHISQADKFSHFGDKWMAALKTGYAEEISRVCAKQAGATFVGKKTLPNGKIRLRFAYAR